MTALFQTCLNMISKEKKNLLILTLKYSWKTCTSLCKKENTIVTLAFIWVAETTYRLLTFTKQKVASPVCNKSIEYSTITLKLLTTDMLRNCINTVKLLPITKNSIPHFRYFLLAQHKNLSLLLEAFEMLVITQNMYELCPVYFVVCFNYISMKYIWYSSFSLIYLAELVHTNTSFQIFSCLCLPVPLTVYLNFHYLTINNITNTKHTNSH